MNPPSPNPIKRIDLNCDLGELDTPAGIANDLALLDLITSANIACGAHAGNEATMARTIEAAKQRGVAIGAHPSYPDVKNFGRVELPMSESEIEQTVADQIRALAAIAKRAGAPLRHVKPHGALYHATMTKPSIAKAIARAAWSIDPALILVGLAATPLPLGLAIWRDMSDEAHIAAEAFADRRYEPDGSLRSRTLPGALITDPSEAADQALHLIQGTSRILPQTICIHSDTPNAAKVAAAVRTRLQSAGLRLAPL